MKTRQCLRRPRSLIFFCLLLLTAGCSTVNFIEGSQAKMTYEQESWHHIGVLRLIEFSTPVNLQAACSNGWSAVRTRTGPLQVLVGLIAGGIYNPEEVSISCR
ncbi:MAG: hypothetical protein C5B49_15525 [Bdellovibrio sp.]|nr:MAG: hypothetical protein C5B49_15525 [Bdellovibrio sp.]